MQSDIKQWGENNTISDPTPINLLLTTTVIPKIITTGTYNHNSIWYAMSIVNKTTSSFEVYPGNARLIQWLAIGV